MATRVAGGADTGVVIDAVDTRGTVCTGVTGTFVDVDLTAQSCEARSTAAQSEVTLDHAVSPCQRQQRVRDNLKKEE